MYTILGIPFGICFWGLLCPNDVSILAAIAGMMAPDDEYFKKKTLMVYYEELMENEGAGLLQNTSRTWDTWD